MTLEPRILVIEDEEQLSRMLRATLIQAGYAVTLVKTGAEGLKAMLQLSFGVVLLDLGLPDMDGKDVISQARAISPTPIVVISARGSEKEKIAALDLGASDYLAKPFDVGELLARIRVALRDRPEASIGNAAANRGLKIDIASRRAIVDGLSVRLSRKETEFLHLLAEAAGQVVAHDRILETIWGRGADADLMNVRVLAWQVRRKIEPDVAAPRFLIAEAREGYRLNLD
ncbi:MAG: response regulator transcription factor [Phenylobacterium sp.]